MHISTSILLLVTVTHELTSNIADAANHGLLPERHGLCDDFVHNSRHRHTGRRTMGANVRRRLVQGLIANTHELRADVAISVRRLIPCETARTELANRSVADFVELSKPFEIYEAETSLNYYYKMSVLRYLFNVADSTPSVRCCHDDTLLYRRIGSRILSKWYELNRSEIRRESDCDIHGIVTYPRQPTCDEIKYFVYVILRKADDILAASIAYLENGLLEGTVI